MTQNIISSPQTSFNPGKDPQISKKAFVHPLAGVTGDVIIEDHVIVKAGSQIVADEGFPMKIGKGTNVQENCVFHGLETMDHHGHLVEKNVVYDQEGKYYSILLEEDVTIAHKCTIHGPSKIMKKAFIGFDSIIHNSEIGEETFVAFGARIIGVKVPAHRYVPTGSIIETQAQADQLPLVTDDRKKFVEGVRKVNRELAEGYLKLFS